jgi:hypothetical protein
MASRDWKGLSASRFVYFLSVLKRIDICMVHVYISGDIVSGRWHVESAYECNKN